jgi:HD-GYP domain-containing protein (c-di-GMP phosphodiesterase class II)
MAATRIPLPLGLVRLGEKLAHDVYDRSGKLLLRGGTPIETESRLAHLEAIGFYDPEAAEWVRARAVAKGPAGPAAGYVPDRSGPALSARVELAGACAALQSLVEGDGTGFEAGVRAIAATVHRCASLDSDASLCCIHIPQPFAYSVRHPVNVAVLVAILLLRQKHDEARLASALEAALTMNIGSLDLHHELYYQEEAITPEQRARIHGHPRAGVDALLQRGVHDPLWMAIVLQHHEAVDGSGYPGALTGERILPEAQALSLADRYCALVSERAQRDPMPPALALQEIHARHGKSIAPDWMRALVTGMGIYPPGSFVRLVNGETAIVARRLLDPKHPVVFSIADAAGRVLQPPRKRVTASQPQLGIAASIGRTQVEAPLPVAELWPPLQLAGGGSAI